MAGNVIAGGIGPAVHQSVIFERANGGANYTTFTDSRSRFAISLPPGDYELMASLDCASDPRHCRFAAGPPELTISAGQHIELSLSTCIDLWQCPR